MTERANKSPALSILIVAVVLSALGGHAQSRRIPSEARQRYSLAQDYLKQGRREQAVTELKTAIQLAPEFVEAHIDYIANHQAKPEIAAEYETHLKQHPGSAVYYYLAGKAYAKAGRNDDRDAAFRKSLELNPGFSWTLVELGALALDDDDKGKAAEYFEKARAKAGDSPRLHMTLASRLNSVQRFNSALAEVERALKLDPDAFDAYPTLWRTRLRSTWGAEKSQAEVMKDIRNLEKRIPGNPKALDAVARGHAIFFDDAEEERVRRAILAIDPKYFLSSGTAMSIQVITAAGKELRFAGPDVERIDGVGWLGDPKAQLAAYREIEGLVKDEDLKLHVVYMREARAFMNDGDFESALRLLGLMERGGVRVASLKGEMAAAMLDRKLTLDTAARFIDEGIAAVRKDFAQQGAAKGSAGRGAAGNSMLAGWLYLSGRLLVMQEKPEQAVALLNESIQLAETEATALDLGKAYERLNRIDEAVKMLLVACSFDGARKQEAREALARIYGDRETVRPLEAEIREAVEKRKATRPPGSSYVQKGLALKGKPAPPFELASASGQKVNLSDYQGRVMLLNFWATW